MAAWDEMLDAFRALGGTADNISLGTGAFGRGLFEHANRMHFLNLLAAIEGVDGAMAGKLRLMARLQLQTMSFAFGVRAV